MQVRLLAKYNNTHTVRTLSYLRKLFLCFQHHSVVQSLALILVLGVKCKKKLHIFRLKWVYLGLAYFAETENFLPKVL